MELLKLSKFKLQLQSMIGEVRDLRVRRMRFLYIYGLCIFFAPPVSLFVSFHFTTGVFAGKGAISSSINKQKQTEEEYMRKVHELQAELASSRETQEALERKVWKILILLRIYYTWSL
ncbi:hypothetical protein ARALYDRAFT_471157 [Arabidopsis lyrata subsp. lyrata]|uniref:Uncharacterized protein n=1 Tax=Arabidopsis lyrata subsp. lyrata TaxID=81972 RepID=D7KKQ9_ARALL|nr:hypothetical protein ARALYDRAFT_471157 [Arabidopsis lyrata subsp. lyrata]